MDDIRRQIAELMSTVEPVSNAKDFTDASVCHHYLTGLCPHDLFHNTKQYFGPCDKTHDDELREEYQKARETTDYGYEAETLALLKPIIEDCNRRIARQSHGGRCDDAVAVGTNLEAVTAREAAALEEEIAEKLKAAEEAGAEGEVERAMQFMDEVTELQVRKSQLTEEKSTRLEEAKHIFFQKLRPCESCGALLSEKDGSNRLNEHFTGRVHLGYEAVRSHADKLEEFLRTHNNRPYAGLVNGTTNGTPSSIPTSNSRLPEDRSAAEYSSARRNNHHHQQQQRRPSGGGGSGTSESNFASHRSSSGSFGRRRRGDPGGGGYHSQPQQQQFRPSRDNNYGGAWSDGRRGMEQQRRPQQYDYESSGGRYGGRYNGRGGRVRSRRGGESSELGGSYTRQSGYGYGLPSGAPAGAANEFSEFPLPNHLSPYAQAPAAVAHSSAQSGSMLPPPFLLPSPSSRVQHNLSVDRRRSRSRERNTDDVSSGEEGEITHR